MPGMDGIETVRRMRSHYPLNADTPVIALTAHVLMGEREKLMAEGMNDYCSKPVNEQQLRDILRRWTVHKMTSMEAQDDTILFYDKPLSSMVIDWEQCVSLAGSREDLARDMLCLLIEDLPILNEQIQNAMQKQDADQLAHHVHKLHGACCYVGVPRLKQAAKLFEAAIKLDQKDKWPELDKELIQSIAEVQDYIKSSNLLDSNTTNAIA
jgi:two-component system sensor histidine kinase BarA